MDTNIILRYLTNNIPSQAEKVKKRFLDASKGKIQFDILPITVVEIIFQLENWYDLAKEESYRFEAINLYRLKNIDFVDLLVFVTAKNDNKKILSFDKDFDKLSLNIRLES